MLLRQVLLVGGQPQTCIDAHCTHTNANDDWSLCACRGIFIYRSSSEEHPSGCCSLGRPFVSWGLMAMCGPCSNVDLSNILALTNHLTFSMNCIDASPCYKQLIEVWDSCLKLHFMMFRKILALCMCLVNVYHMGQVNWWTVLLTGELRVPAEER